MGIVAALQRVEPHIDLFLGFGRIISYGTAEGVLQPGVLIRIFLFLLVVGGGKLIWSDGAG